MGINEVHNSDIGTIFRLTIKDQDDSAVDVSAATTKQIIFKKADGTESTEDASFTSDGTDGQIEYAATSGDLNVNGVWLIQAKVVLAAGTFYSDVHQFVVHSNVA